MRPWRGIAGVCFVAWLTLGVDSAQAAWDNVFQTACFRNRAPRVSTFYAPATDCCPKPAPTISYRQRCYYQPVTSYRMQTKWQPVTSYRRSYYYEPVTSYRYTSYYDPCTGCCRRVACPVTSYRLRSKCNAVVSYVQRCEMVPVTTYRRSCCYEPVVCNDPCPDPCPTCPPATTPGISEVPGSIPPVIEEGTGPGISEDNGRLGPQGLPLNGDDIRRSERAPSSPTPAEPPRAQPPTRLDRIASYSAPRLQGRVVARDQSTPKGGAKLIFVSAKSQNVRQSVVADRRGRFDVELPAGDWLMYIGDGSGKAVYHSRVPLAAKDHRLVTVVSR